MVRRLFAFCCIVVVLLAIAGPMGAAEPSIEEYVKVFNPDLYVGKEGAPMANTFTTPGSDIAHDVNHMFWFTLLVFLPFLILPQILLLVAVYRFRQKKGDNRKPATWIHSMRLEVAWTVVPILAVIVVGIPVLPLLYKMELPPENINDAVQITVHGRQFAWDYTYKHEGVELKLDPVNGHQESLVLPVGRTVSLAITSNDVNHAWWIPAFGVKKDAIIGRYNSCWFTPDTIGFFKGQCAELCGPSHGRMIIGAVIVEPQHFDRWLTLQKHRDDASSVWNAVLGWKAGSDDAAVRTAVLKYRSKSTQVVDSDFALRYWIAHNSVSFARRDPGGNKESPEFAAWQADLTQMESRKTLVGDILASLTLLPQSEAVVTASIQE